MYFWLIAIPILFAQEGVTTAWLIAAVYQKEPKYLFILFAIFLVFNTFEIPIFYSLGKRLKANQKLWAKIKNSRFYTRMKNKRIPKWIVHNAKKLIDNIKRLVGTRQRQVLFFYLGTLAPAWSVALVSPWADLSLKQIYLPVFLGVTLWFILIVLIVLGVNKFVTDANIALFVILGITILFTLIEKLILNKKK
ncbi:MAG: hypothetical protein ABIQ40_00620 [Bacteroidia bacterium]